MSNNKPCLNPEKENLMTIDETKREIEVISIKANTNNEMMKDQLSAQNNKIANEMIAKIELTSASHFPLEKLVYVDKLQSKSELIL